MVGYELLTFAFDVSALLNKTYKQGFVSSFSLVTISPASRECRITGAPAMGRFLSLPLFPKTA